ncbi:MAG: CDP-diacylglycerol--glycerol-3-phosphate 3-phosphatidyltransferase [bacterium]
MANLLTFLRILLIAPITLCFLVPDTAAVKWTAFTLFIIAGFSDFLDGYFARRNNSISKIGTILDPIADKLLTIALLILLTASGALYGVHLIAALIIALREILISGLREALANQNMNLPVNFVAKMKTTLQFIALALLLIPIHALQPIGLISLWSAAALTLWTGWQYVATALRALQH